MPRKRKTVPSQRKVFSFRLDSDNVEAVRRKQKKENGKDGVNLSAFVDAAFKKEALK